MTWTAGDAARLVAGGSAQVQTPTGPAIIWRVKSGYYVRRPPGISPVATPKTLAELAAWLAEAGALESTGISREIGWG